MSLGFELSFTLRKQSQVSNPIYSGYFGDGVLQTISLDWPQIAILPM
jgi:hypothetical protein